MQYFKQLYPKSLNKLSKTFKSELSIKFMKSLKMLKTEQNSQTEKLPTVNLTENPEQYKKDMLQMLENKEKHLLYTLERLKEYSIREYNQKKEKALKDLEKIDNITDGEEARAFSLNITLPFTDQVKHLQDKLSNVLHTKQFYLNVNNDMGKAIQLTDEETKIARENFDLVCNYQKRREQCIESETLYNQPLMKYLVQKTFKKSAADAYAAISSYDITKYIPKDKPSIKIVSVGGGPGSDLTGILCYLMEMGYFKFECWIYDYNDANWEAVCSEYLGEILKSQSKKVFGKEIDAKIKWEFCDLKKDWKDKSKIPKGDIFSICWALNESIYHPKFWEELISWNNHAIFFFIDGDRYPIEHFRLFDSLRERKYIYEGLETPRRLAIFPVE